VVTLTDLTPTVAAWLGHQVPAGTVGARITRGERGDLGSTIASLIARDTAEQVWIATHGWFFIGYVAADALAFGLPVLLFWGGEEERRRRRARCWRHRRGGGGRGSARLVPGEPGSLVVLDSPRLVAVRG